MLNPMIVAVRRPSEASPPAKAATRRRQSLLPVVGTSPPIFLESPYPQFAENRPGPELGPASPGRSPAEPQHLESLGSPVPRADPLTQFQDWAADLDDGGDDRTSGGWGLPAAEDIGRICVEPQDVYAFILVRASIQHLRTFLDDAAVRSVNITADVAFDLDASGTDG